MGDKLIISKATTSHISYKCLKMDNATHDRIRALSEKAGTSMVEMVRKMVSFCEERIEVKGGE